MPLTMSELVHPTAIIDPEAEIAPDVQIGPYTIIEGPVEIGAQCVIEAHVSLSGPLTIGRGNHIGHGSVIGKSPQHRGFRGEPTSLIIGDHNIIREHVTIHRGTVQGGGLTKIGNNNMFMVGSHVGHDSIVHNNCTITNGALIAGHVTLFDNCILSGHSAIQQRVRIGRLAMIGGLGSTTKDVPPFVLHQGYNCTCSLNSVGLRRAGFTADTMAAIREAFRIFYKEGRLRAAAIERIEADLPGFPEVAEFVNFIRESTLGVNPLRTADRVNRIH